MPDLTRRSLLAGGLVGVAVLPLLAVRAQAQGYGQAAQTAQAATSQVVIQGMAFNPASLAVAAGTTVTFVNQDSVPHTVTSDDGLFDTGQLSPGQSAQLTFAGAGTYPYHCAIHPSMKGVLTVA